jgi:hypothetical protein
MVGIRLSAAKLKHRPLERFASRSFTLLIADAAISE